MEAAAAPPRHARAAAAPRQIVDRIGDSVLYVLTALAALLGVLVVVAIIWQLVERRLAGDQGVRALVRLGQPGVWNPRSPNVFGAREYLIGTVVTSFGAVLIAAPISIAIGLFLSELAPPAIRGPIGTLVDMLAAVPSVVDRALGDLRARAVQLHRTIEPFLNVVLGWIPIFGDAPPTGARASSSAIIVLTIMIDPDHLVDLPRALHRRPERARGGLDRPRRDSLGDGARRSPSRPCAAVSWRRSILGLGRALGEAIAVTQVIGNFIPLQRSIFEPGDTLASRIANQYQGAISTLELLGADLPRR